MWKHVEFSGMETLLLFLEFSNSSYDSYVEHEYLF